MLEYEACIVHHILGSFVSAPCLGEVLGLFVVGSQRVSAKHEAFLSKYRGDYSCIHCTIRPFLSDIYMSTHVSRHASLKPSPPTFTNHALVQNLKSGVRHKFSRANDSSRPLCLAHGAHERASLAVWVPWRLCSGVLRLSQCRVRYSSSEKRIR